MMLSRVVSEGIQMHGKGFKWIGHDLIGLGGDIGKETHFKRAWCNVVVQVEQYSISYVARAYDHNHEDLPGFPLTRSAPDNIEEAQRERLLPEQWDGHVIQGRGKMVHHPIVWSNFAAGRPGEVRTVEPFEAYFENIDFWLSGSNKHTYGKLITSKLQFEEAKLRARLYLEPERLKAFVTELRSAPGGAGFILDILASIFYARNENGEYMPMYVMPHGVLNSAEAVISSMTVHLKDSRVVDQ